jgi:hypothetical protein
MDDDGDEFTPLPVTRGWKRALQRLVQGFPFRVMKDVVLVLLAMHGVVMLVYPASLCNWRGAVSEQRQAEDDACAQLALLQQPPEPVPAQDDRCKQMLDPMADPLVCDCGNSVAEAIARGCTYDELAVAWLPDHCRDVPLLSQFLVAGDGPAGQWLHWRYPNRTGLLTDKEVATMADDPSHPKFYSSGTWHLIHCIYYWRKQIRQRNSGVVIEPRYNNINYIMACAETFMLEDYSTALTEATVSLHSNVETVALRSNQV